MQVIIEQIGKDEEEQIIIRCHNTPGAQPGVIEMPRTMEHLIGYEDTAMHRIPVNDILYLEAAEGKTYMYCEEHSYQMKQRLYEIEGTLSDLFIRVSRTVILNWTKISRLRPLLNGRMEATLEDEERIIISRQYVPNLKDKFHV